MSAAGTVVATSADGAGDMPSLEPAAGAGRSGGRCTDLLGGAVPLLARPPESERCLRPIAAAT